jgi:hypothetical protein
MSFAFCLLLLCQAVRGSGSVFVGEHGSVDDVGEPAFEDAEAFHTAVATVSAPLEQGAMTTSVDEGSLWDEISA